MSDSLDRVVIPALAIIMLGLWVFLSHALTKVVKRLQNTYPILWESLGRPPAPMVIAGFDVLLLLSFANPEFTRWLASKQYAKLGDDTIAVWAQRLKDTLRVLIGVLVVAVGYALIRLIGAGSF